MTTYDVEGCGADQRIEAESVEDAAREAAVWQYGDGARVEWYGSGPDSALAEYAVRVDGARLYGRRVVVRAVA